MATLSVHASAGNSTRTEIRAGRHTILIDEPPFFGGADEAPSPVETLLAALAKDTRLAVRYIEMMPIGLGKSLSPLGEARVRELLEGAFGKLDVMEKMI